MHYHSLIVISKSDDHFLISTFLISCFLFPHSWFYHHPSVLHHNLSKHVLAHFFLSPSSFIKQSSRNCNIREKFICQTSECVSKDGLVFREMNRLCLRLYCAVPRYFWKQFEALKTSTVGTRVVYGVNKRRVESLKW